MSLAAEQISLSQARILIVEDEPIVAQDLREQLAKLGYDPVAVSATGEEALALAGQQRPDLVLMDIELAGAMDGIRAGTGPRAPVRHPRSNAFRSHLHPRHVPRLYGKVVPT